MNKTMQQNPTKTTWGAMGVLVVAVGAGIWYMVSRRDQLKITSYQNLTTGEIKEYPNILEINTGDQVQVFFELIFPGELTGEFHAAIWQSSFIDPHDEVANANKPFTHGINGNTTSTSLVIDSSPVSTGMYGLYVKVMRSKGKDIFSPYYAEVIRVNEADGNGNGAKTDFRDLEILSYTDPVKEGEDCIVEIQWEHKGPAEQMNLYVAIGEMQGLFDLRFFNEHSKDQTVVDMEASTEWTSYTQNLNVPINTKLPAKNSPYDIKAKLYGFGNLDSVNPTIETQVREDVINVIGDGDGVEIPTAGMKNETIALVDGSNPTYNLGDSVAYRGSVEYRGIAQRAEIELTIERFTEKHELAPSPFNLEESISWAKTNIEGTFIIPSNLTPGKTYTIDVRYTSLEEVTSENWKLKSAFTIAKTPSISKEVFINLTVIPTPAAGEITVSPIPLREEGNFLYFPEDTKVTLSVVSVHADYEWVGWKGENISDTSNKTVTTSPLGKLSPEVQFDIQAIFQKKAEPVLRTLLLRIGEGKGSIIPSKPGVKQEGAIYYYLEGETLSVTAKAQSGYAFERWGGNASGSTNPLPVTMNTDMSIIAYFKTLDIEKYIDISILPGNIAGTVVSSPAPTRQDGRKFYYPLNQTVKLSASRKTGYEWSHWVGDVSSLSSTITLTMWTNLKVTAVFEPVVTIPDADMYGVSFQITNSGPYVEGDRVNWMLTGKYKGMRQSGRITISVMDTLFRTKFTTTKGITFSESSAWSNFFFSGNFTIPSGLSAGTYYVRAKIEALSDSTLATPAVMAITVIAEEVTYTLTTISNPPGIGYVRVEPDKVGYTKFEVPSITAFVNSAYASSYKFDYWDVNGSIRSENPNTALIMKDTVVIAYFKRI